MKQYLLAVDGSEYSKKAAEKAVELAAATTAKVTVLNVINEQITMNTWPDPEVSQMVKDKFFEEAEEIVNEVKEIFVKNGVKVNTVIKHGNVAEEICNEASTGEYEMIIMGNRGLSGIQRVILGSVTNKVLYCTSTSVYIVKS
jgi:nucleotide-binding universal stress UspA family protein